MDTMMDIAQHLLEYEMFYGVGSTALAGFIRGFWQPKPCLSLAPDQLPGTISVTKTATTTVTPKPSTITAKAAKTMYDTVTEQVTSVSVDRKYITKYTHYPIDPATPCTTFTHTYTSAGTVTSIGTVSPNAVTTDSSPVWATWALIFLVTIATVTLLRYYMTSDSVSDELDDAVHRLSLAERRFQAEHARYEEIVEMAKKLRAKLEEVREDRGNLDLRVKMSNILFQKLGVYEEGGEDPSNETLPKMVEAQIDEILALRSENVALKKRLGIFKE
ncbi:hypothetical protein GMOD_00001017 [Pyrenophora seminiperda CCB06]|uniref:Uncharacterized protein n=1 Tax=Pyrenophora seminiperda CCB06 TaxID=1302712 RepID=A0A3M7LY15_9PLEO|nr:hypothetical protein GMOD_00001017 [Pyrenophora seminiperda CCB06]